MAILKVHMIKNEYHVHSLAYPVRVRGGISSAASPLHQRSFSPFR
jgi:hypothetical protein